MVVTSLPEGWSIHIGQSEDNLPGGICSLLPMWRYKQLPYVIGYFSFPPIKSNLTVQFKHSI